MHIKLFFYFITSLHERQKMYLMYVDESGDSGLVNSPTRYYILSGLVVHELRWQTYLNELINFRRRMKEQFGLRLREEIHASNLISRPGELVRIGRHNRLTIIRAFATTLASMTDLNLINIKVDKFGKSSDYNVFGNARTALIQRFENTISYRNFPGPANPDDRGFILCDHTENKKLMQLLRQMRRYNPVPHQSGFGRGYRDIPLRYVIEDPSFRDSAHSYFVQAVDLAAFLLYQRLNPNAYMRKNSGQNYFLKLQPILCLPASPRDLLGIVSL
ncbi:MAG: DUF3800 domain-containing protein [candidate division Zixibacteria bacterium]|nr:DUF3800 domain-containing protein [candidate division Zixibacteria bacterium]